MKFLQWLTSYLRYSMQPLSSSYGQRRFYSETLKNKPDLLYYTRDCQLLSCYYNQIYNRQSKIIQINSLITFELQFQMNIQKIKIKLPQKPDVSGLIRSKACQSLPHPQLFNQIPQQINYYPLSKPVYLSTQSSQNRNIYIDNQSRSIETSYYQNRSPAHAHMGSSNVSITVPQRDINTHSPLAASIASSVQEGKRSRNRPKSPKVQFNYVSPVKDKNKLSSIIERSNESELKHKEYESIKNQDMLKEKEKKMFNLQMNQRSKFLKEPTEIQDTKLDRIIKQKEERNYIDKKKSTINNNVYLIQSLNDDYSQNVKNSLEEGSNLNISNNLERHYYEKQQIVSQNKNKNENGYSYFEANSSKPKYVEGYFIYDNNQNATDKYDEDMRRMQEEYQKLKKLDNSQDENFLPRIQSNSSENQYFNDFDSKQSNSLVNKNIDYKGTFGNVNELDVGFIQSELPLRHQDKGKKVSSQIVKQDLIISGIQSIKSEIMEHPKKKEKRVIQKSEEMSKKKAKQRVIDESEEFAQESQIKLESRDQLQIEYEKESDYKLKIKQRDVQIKNLKNQVWLMRIRQKQLLSTIQRLQQINKDQNILIDKLSKNK